jgi:hypothetical protein
MNLDYAIPDATFSAAEMHQIASVVQDPTLRKYLVHLQKGIIKSIGNGLPKSGETPESYVLRQAVVVGGLDAIETLLKIEKPQQQA